MTAFRPQPSSVRARAALVALAAAAVLCLAPASGAQRASGVSVFWQRLAQCETGGRWDWGRYAGTSRARSAEGTSFEGGLGFAASTWQLWARAVHVLDEFPHAWMAPPPVQVRVAAYGLRRGGYWGCLHR
jgi:hypothetical protein